MHPKTTARLGLKLIGVFLLIHGSLAFLDRFQPILLSLTFGATGRADQLLARLPYPVLTLLLTVPVGIYLVLGGAWLASRIVPDNKPRCPECGYQLAGLDAERCPECATRLPQTSGPLRAQDASVSPKPVVRVLVRLLGVAIIVLKLDELTWEATFFASDLLGFGQYDRPWARPAELSDFLTIGLGLYLLLGGGWVADHLLLWARPRGPDRQNKADITGRGPHGSRGMVFAFVRLLGLIFLVLGGRGLLALVSWLMQDYLQFGYERGWVPYAGRGLAEALKLVVGGYFFFRGRWVTDRLLGSDRPDTAKRSVVQAGEDTALGRAVVMLLGITCLVLAMAQLCWTGPCLLYCYLMWGSDSYNFPHEAVKTVVFCLQAGVGIALLLGADRVLRRLTHGGFHSVGEAKASTHEELQRDWPVPVQRNRAWVSLLLGILGVYLCIVGTAELLQAIGWVVHTVLEPGWFSLQDQLAVATPHFLRVAIGVWLLWAHRRLAQWIVPPHRAYCPACGYESKADAGPNCQECDAPLDAVAKPAPVS